MCFLKYLPASKVFSGVIVKEESGHCFYTPFSADKGKVGKIRKNLEKLGANIVCEASGDKAFLRQLILDLNKKAGLPGINNKNKTKAA